MAKGEQDLYVVGIAAMIICSVFQSVIFVISFAQLYCHTIHISQCTKSLVIIAIAGYLLCTIGDTIQMILRYMLWLPLEYFNPDEAKLVTIKDLFYFGGILSFFLLLLTKIRSSFQLSKPVQLWLLFLIITSTLISIYYALIWSLFMSDNENRAKIDLPWTIATISLAVVNFLIFFSLLLVFIYKIKHKDSLEGVDYVMHISINGSMDYDYNKKAIWNVMIKHCVLFGFAILSDQSFYITNLTQTGYKYIGWDVRYSKLLIVHYLCRAVGNTVSILILWLVLSINNDKYICLCKCVHSCTSKYCFREDANMIREGFVNEDRHYKISDKIEGINLVVTKRTKSDNIQSEIPYLMLTNA